MTARRRDKALAFVASAARAGKELIETMSKPIPADPPRETAAQLRTRRPALLEQIETATKAIAEARLEHEQAFKQFEGSDSEQDAAKVFTAEQRIEVRKRRLADFQQQLEAHDAATQAADRAELERGRDALQRQIDDRTEAAELERIEVEAYIATIDARLERVRQLERRVELQRALYSVQVKLGGEHPPAFQGESTVPSAVPIAEALRARAKALPIEDPRRERLEQLAYQLAPGLASGFRGAA